MNRILLYTCLLFSLIACKEEDDNPMKARGSYDRTVLVYIAGENNLSQSISDDLNEMRAGSKDIGSNNVLAVYVDASGKDSLPYIARIADGEIVDKYIYPTDPLSSDPDVMAQILGNVSSRYPALEYGLVLWGHGSGFVGEDSVAYTPRRAFGVDNGENTSSDQGKWINIPTLAKVLQDWGHHLKFIFGDNCYFQSIETAYELRHVADYLIGSPAEIPGRGAPYNTVVKSMFSQSDDFYKAIVDSYFQQTIPVSYDGWNSYTARVALSVIRTSELEQLAQSTRVLLTKMDPTTSPNLTSLLYYGRYYYIPERKRVDTYYDMNDYFLHHANTEDYDTWKTSYDRAVIYKVYDKWETYTMPMSIFQRLSDERYGGVSMYIPQQRTDTQFYNDCASYIKNLEWYEAAGLQSFGW